MLKPTATSSIYFRNPLCTISYHAEGYLQLLWTAVATTGPELQALYEHTLQALRHHRTGKLLTDHRQRQPLPLSTQQWIAQEWIPRAVREASYSHCAIVENQTPLGRLAARAVGEAVAIPLTFRFFSVPTEAVAWLAQA
ncbi:hypothetical protein [Hymenobacter elongatus]|uniref:STAS/SEC14 domain-containing protein n=1 Tax=Hymenobacter elongatus TaxID=877208 RepID=A0A4Z0PII6_9BACT|nr:hypothetical protein [Hymenobacter elongatus]TGE14691.1 hypothetical protein E5J99_15015 [Hymenobacter elongatus]